MLSSVWEWLMQAVHTLGYAGIIGLMALESSFFPFPSEVVVPPGGALAREGRMSLVLVIASGIAGSLLGALFNYWFALKLGRPAILAFVRRFGKYFLLSERKFLKAEAFFRRHGEIATFIGRLVPGVRQVISFPAGLARMNLLRFCLFTSLGAGIWVTILALIGHALGPELGSDLDTVMEQVGPHARAHLVWILPALAVLVAGYVLWYRRRRARGRGREEEPS
jgi:membrane protein DedA with SNARE-associated domain